MNSFNGIHGMYIHVNFQMVSTLEGLKTNFAFVLTDVFSFRTVNISFLNQYIPSFGFWVKVIVVLLKLLLSGIGLGANKAKVY